MYNDFIILRAFFLREKICCVRIFNWNLVVFIIYSNFPVRNTAINQNAKYTCFDRFKFWYLSPINIRIENKIRASWQIKLMLMTQCSLQLCLCLVCNTAFYLSKRWDPIRVVLIYRRRKNRLCNHYTRQDCPMDITDTILQYYTSSFTSIQTHTFTLISTKLNGIDQRKECMCVTFCRHC